jgi:uncharacterized membrane protein YcjF (UPF0283 family)
MAYKDKLPLSSKKFICFLFSMIMITGVLVVALVLQDITWPLALFMSAGMISNGALAVGYILGQVSLDKYLAGMARIASKQKIREEEEDSDEE